MGYSPWGRKESDTTERLHFTSSILTKLANMKYTDISMCSILKI